MNESEPTTEAVDATRRTRLASERTELAWWRTGLTALAVALAVGRVIPGLDHDSANWPYDIAHAALALSGVALGLLTILIVVIS
jgi:putative membrane protein